MLSREAASHALSATLGIALTALAGLAVLTAGRLPAVTLFGVGGWSWAILLAYLLGARMLFINQRIAVRLAAEARIGEPESSVEGSYALPPIWQSAVLFVTAAAVLFVTGPRLAHVAGALAEETGLGGTFVGTTLVAVSTSLPELAATITAVRLGAIDLAIGNAFGSNAFNMVLFVPLDAVHDGPLFTEVSATHAVTAFAVVLATAIAILGQLYHGERRLPLIEPDACLMLLVLLGALVMVYSLS
jgi:cation:H+ antiporter